LSRNNLFEICLLCSGGTENALIQYAEAINDKNKPIIILSFNELNSLPAAFEAIARLKH